MRPKLNRRGFLGVASSSIATAIITEIRSARAQHTTGGSKNVKPELANVKACVFDTFGTVVDWRSSVIAETTTWGKGKHLNINWAEFTDRWRLGYRPAMDKVRKGEIPWTNLDDLQRTIFDGLVKEYQIDGRSFPELSEVERAEWTHVWRRLKPWPDSVHGLTRLKTRYVISPMSNGNVALMTHLAKF